MKSINVLDLKSGMIFNRAVYIEGNNILVPPDIPIKQKDIDRLRNWDIVEVFTEGSLISTGSLEDIDPSAVSEYRQESKLSSFLEKGIDNLDKIFKDITKNTITPMENETVKNIVQKIFDHIHDEGNLLFQKAAFLGGDRNDLPVRSMNCAIFSAIIGKEVLRSKQDLKELIMAALLHDTGMLRVPDSILYKKGKLQKEELETIKNHPGDSHDVITKMNLPGKVAKMALYHHERWNGSGYPEKLKSTAIPIGSRIIAVADAFEALINNRPYRKYQIGYDAIKAILSDNGTHFDPDILKVFLKTIGIYPLGSIVVLNDGSYGQVVRGNAKAPLRPVVQLINNSSDKVIDLMKHKSLFITRAVDPNIMEEESTHGE